RSSPRDQRPTDAGRCQSLQPSAPKDPPHLDQRLSTESLWPTGTTPAETGIERVRDRTPTEPAASGNVVHVAKTDRSHDPPAQPETFAPAHPPPPGRPSSDRAHHQPQDPQASRLQACCHLNQRHWG